MLGKYCIKLNKGTWSVESVTIHCILIIIQSTKYVM